MIACLVDVDNNLNHHSDHRALVTVISLKCDDGCDTGTDPSPEKAWHKADKAKFITELKARISSPITPLTFANITSLDSHISDSIIHALNSSSPNLLKSHKHKAWWNPPTMDPLRKAAARARRAAHTHPTEENRATYRSAQNTYFHTIKTKKVRSWRSTSLL